MARLWYILGARKKNAAPWRGARVVDWDGLENRCAGNRTEGSNPSLSAKCNFRLPRGKRKLHLAERFYPLREPFLNGTPDHAPRAWWLRTTSRARSAWQRQPLRASALAPLAGKTQNFLSFFWRLPPDPPPLGGKGKVRKFWFCFRRFTPPKRACK